MQVVFQLYEVKNLLADAAELGAKKALIDAGLVKPFISASQAHRKYGRRVVDRWIADGHITPFKDGSKNSTVRLDRLILETLSKSNNSVHYFNYPGSLKAA